MARATATPAGSTLAFQRLHEAIERHVRACVFRLHPSLVSDTAALPGRFPRPNPLASTSLNPPRRVKPWPPHRHRRIRARAATQGPPTPIESTAPHPAHNMLVTDADPPRCRPCPVRRPSRGAARLPRRTQYHPRRPLPPPHPHPARCSYDPHPSRTTSTPRNPLQVASASCRTPPLPLDARGRRATGTRDRPSTVQIRNHQGSLLRPTSFLCTTGRPASRPPAVRLSAVVRARTPFHWIHWTAVTPHTLPCAPVPRHRERKGRVARAPIAATQEEVQRTRHATQPQGR